MLEKTIEKNICDYAKKLGFLAYKFTSPNRRSVPDRLFITDKGKVLFIEFKAEGKKPTPMQSREIETIQATGCAVYVIDNVADGKILMDGIADGLLEA